MEFAINILHGWVFLRGKENIIFYCILILFKNIVSYELKIKY